MVPSSSTAFSGDIRGEVASPLATAARKPALTYAASSTPGGTRLTNKSVRNSSSPAGGFFSSSTSAAIWEASKGLGTIPWAARSATCLRYSSSTTLSSLSLCRAFRPPCSLMENTLPFLVQVEVPGFAEGRIAGFRLFVNLFTKIQHNPLCPFCPLILPHQPAKLANRVTPQRTASQSQNGRVMSALAQF